MTRYRKVDVRMWDDKRFKALSPIAPSGRALWFFLLTNPETSVIPGCYRATESGMAEYLGWDMKAFREVFREVFREGLAKADWDARVVWIPNACKYDGPASPNVVKSWRVVWDELPECDLKTEIWRGLKSFTDGLSKGFQEAFLEACPQPSRIPEPEPEPEPDTRSQIPDPDTRSRYQIPEPKAEVVSWPAAISTTADFEQAIAEWGWSVSGLSPKQIAKVHRITKAGAISKGEYEPAKTRADGKDRPVAYFLSVVEGERKQATEEANKPSYPPKQREPERSGCWARDLSDRSQRDE